MNTTIQTKFGTAVINLDGYYKISSKKEGNFNKLVHRLVFEDFYKIKLPSEIIIHHEDGNKLNNEIWNLIPMSNNEHISLHSKGKKVLEKTRTQISKTLSESKNTCGYYRVSKTENKKYATGVLWSYRYIENGKRISLSSIHLDVLKDKVLANGLEWREWDGD